MGKGLQHIFVCLAIVSIVALGAACGSNEVDNGGKKDDISKTGEKVSEEKARETDEDVGVSAQNISRTESVHEALNDASKSQGIFFGEVPERFPIAFLPLFPNGTIDKSSIRGREATLLQEVPAPKDKIIAYYRNYYRSLGWAANDPIALADRTMVFFSGKDARVDMTLIDREGGKTFVALALY